MTIMMTRKRMTRSMTTEPGKVKILVGSWKGVNGILFGRLRDTIWFEVVVEDEKHLLLAENEFEHVDTDNTVGT